MLYFHSWLDEEPLTYKEEEPTEERYELTIWVVNEEDEEVELHNTDQFIDDELIEEFNKRAERGDYFDTKIWELVDWIAKPW